VRRLPERRDGRPLRPLTPIFDSPKKTGSLDVGNTPTTPVIEFFDDFNRADGDVGANYTAGAISPLPQIVSNACRATNGDNYAAILNQAVPDDLIVSGVVTHGGSTFTTFILWARWDDGSGDIDAYEAIWTEDAGGTVTLNRLDAFSSPTQLAQVTAAGVGSATRFALKCVGTTISIEVGATEVISEVDATHTAGQAGFYLAEDVGASTCVFDDFTVTVP
jgi:hypothetical protein